MDKRFSVEKPDFLDYLWETFTPEDGVLERIHRLATESGLPEIQVGGFDGLHLEVLTRLCGARKAVEIGTLGGYSGICIARGLPENDGRLYTIEVDSKHAAVARQAFEIAGVADRVEIFEGKATDVLPNLESQGPFDLVFVDADKAGYPAYLEWAERNLRVGGVLIGDNTFAFGHIGNPNQEDPEIAETVASIRRFNERAARRGRFRATILPTGEGMTVAVKIR